MKKLSFILRIAVSVLVVIVSLAFTVLEATLLFGGDFMLYQIKTIAFIQQFLKFLIAAAALLLSVISVIKNKQTFVFASFCIFIAMMVAAPFMSNNFGIYFSLLAALFCLTQFFSYKVSAKS